MSENRPGRVAVNYSGTEAGQKIILAESYYPGWVVCEEGICAKAWQENAFMAGRTRAESGNMVFVYRPESVGKGLAVTLVCLLVWGVYVVLKKRQDH